MVHTFRMEHQSPYGMICGMAKSENWCHKNYTHFHPKKILQ
jgi:hypothetical protein